VRTKISDFKLAELIIRKLSDRKDSSFLDLNVVFSGDSQIDHNSLVIGESKNIAHSIYKIIEAYVERVPICDDDNHKQSFLVSTAAFLRQLIYCDKHFEESQHDEFSALRLYSSPLVWLIMRDLICPIYHCKFRNVQIIAGSSSVIDIARFCDKGSFDGTEPEKSFIFLNMDVTNIIVQNVFLLLAAIEAMGLSPHKIVPDLLNSTVGEQFIGILKLAYKDDNDVESFMMMMLGTLGLCDVDLSVLSLKSAEDSMKQVKEAQHFSNPAMWWYFGILEKMLEPARGSDWTTHKSLEPYIKEFWDRVEKYKKHKLHVDGVPFDALLDMKSEDFRTDPMQTIQSLLGSERVW